MTPRLTHGTSNVKLSAGELPTLTSAVPNWRSGDTIPLGRRTLRVLSIRDDDADQPPVPGRLRTWPNERLALGRPRIGLGTAFEPARTPHDARAEVHCGDQSDARYELTSSKVDGSTSAERQMEPLWSPVVATGRNRSQMLIPKPRETKRKPLP